MKYGIHIERSTIKAISRFIDDTVPIDFQEITENQYDVYLAKLSPYSFWDESKNDIVVDTIALDEANLNSTKFKLLDRLRLLSIEIDLTVRMVNDPKDLETNFANVKAQYDALIKGK